MFTTLLRLLIALPAKPIPPWPISKSPSVFVLPIGTTPATTKISTSFRKTLASLNCCILKKKVTPADRTPLGLLRHSERSLRSEKSLFWPWAGFLPTPQIVESSFRAKRRISTWTFTPGSRLAPHYVGRSPRCALHFLLVIDP